VSQKQDVVTVNNNCRPCYLHGYETWSLILNVRLNKGLLDKKITTHIFWILYFQILQNSKLKCAAIPLNCICLT